MRVSSLIVGIILMCSCGSDNSAPSRFKSFISDSLAFKRYQNLTNVLNFSKINLGVDSFELRIWSSLAPTDLAIVTVLKYADSTWQLTETRYWVSYINNYPNPDLFTLDSSSSKKIRPRIDFIRIIDSIESLKLETIPDQNKIPAFEDRTADGMYYTIEVATKSKYKIFSYHNPDRYKDSVHRRVSETLAFFQRNLDAFVMN